MKKNISHCTFIFLCLLFISCQDMDISTFDPIAIAERDSVIIAEYLTAQNIESLHTTSGLHYIYLGQEQSFEKVSPTDSVSIDYTGKLLYGDIFDSSYLKGEKFDFRLNQNRVILGLEEAIELMYLGDSIRFIIPSGLAYGTSGNGDFIPSNSILVFDIKLHEIYP